MKRHYIIGCIAGWAVWIAFAAFCLFYSVSRGQFPKAVRPVFDLATTAMELAAWPLALGGWLAWGEQYMTITSNLPLNIAVGLVLWGTPGVLAAIIIRRWRLRGRDRATAS